MTKKILTWLGSIERNSLIKNSFLFPILLVVIFSCAHVVSWYDIGNPLSWAVYISIAIEIFALASVAAASIKMGRASVWFLFSLVTSIQIIGNVFFEFKHVDMNGDLFKTWMDLVGPFFMDWNPMDHRRLLAIIQGASFPLMSLTALHYYIVFGDKMKVETQVEAQVEKKS